MDRYFLASFIAMAVGIGIMLLSTILPDTDRNGIAGFCVIGGVILGGSPLIVAYRYVKTHSKRNPPQSKSSIGGKG